MLQVKLPCLSMCCCTISCPLYHTATTYCRCVVSVTGISYYSQHEANGHKGKDMVVIIAQCVNRFVYIQFDSTTVPNDTSSGCFKTWVSFWTHFYSTFKKLNKSTFLSLEEYCQSWSLSLSNMETLMHAFITN